MTGLPPEKAKTTSWESFFKSLAGAFNNSDSVTNKDYFFLVVNKSDTGDVFWTSLKRIKHLVANGSNLPFQCDWSRNREPVTRDDAEARKYILSIMKQSFESRARPLDAFKSNLGGYC